MAVDLSTEYLGMKLKNPLGLAACGPLTGDLDMLCRLEEAGAAVAVLPSLFEEQIVHEEMQVAQLFDFQTDSFAESLSHLPDFLEQTTGPEEYLRHVEDAKRNLSIPVIGSLNGSTDGGWVEYAKAIEGAGADALELNIYFVPTDPRISAEDVELQYLELVSHVRQSVEIPVAVKIGQSFTSLPHFAQRLTVAGADGLVLFNRYLEADIDLEALEIKPDLILSSRHEARVPIRWIAILRDHLQVSLAATSGVHRVQGALKLLLAGADVTMMATILLQQGPTIITAMLQQLTEWLEKHEYESVTQLKGSMSHANCPDPSALERANYMKALSTYSTEYTVPH